LVNLSWESAARCKTDGKDGAWQPVGTWEQCTEVLRRVSRRFRTLGALALVSVFHFADNGAPRLVRYRGKPLIVLPGVFNPVRHWSGTLLADNLLVQPGDSVLDMGTGCGIQAICAAEKASRVVACDVNPQAITCARMNAILNGAETKIEFRLSNLFENVGADEKFDLIVFNMPFFHREASEAWQHAFFCGSGGRVLRSFWEQVPAHLTARGRVEVAFSGSITPLMFEMEEFSSSGLRPSLVKERSSLLGHRVCVYLASR